MSDWWKDPVRISFDGRSSINVNNNAQAAELLLSGEWPMSEGTRLSRARSTVLRSMERAGDPGTLYAARMAFEAAAREADVLVEI